MIGLTHKILMTQALLWIGVALAWGQNNVASNYDSKNDCFFTIWGEDPEVLPELDTVVDSKSWSQEMFPELDTVKKFKPMIDYGYVKPKSYIKKDTLNPDAHSVIEFSINGGYCGFTMDSEFGEASRSFGYGAMFNYSYYFNKEWGMRIGIGLNISKSKYEGVGFFDEYNFTDMEGDRLELDINIDDIKEDYSAKLLEIPVMASYKFEDYDFVANAGLKFGIPLEIEYDQKLEGVDIEGYYPAYGTVIDEALAIACSKDKKLFSSGTYSSTPIMVMLSGDFGYRFKLESNNSVGVSFFVDYALNRMQLRAKNDKDNSQYKDGSVTIYDLVCVDADDIPLQLQSASVLSSRQIRSNTRIVERFGYVNLGLKLIFYLESLGKKKAK